MLSECFSLAIVNAAKAAIPMKRVVPQSKP